MRIGRWPWKLIASSGLFLVSVGVGRFGHHDAKLIGSHKYRNG
jgi:hypothetical protein